MMLQAQSAVGVAALIGLAFAFSASKGQVPWRFVFSALAAGFAIAAVATLLPGALTILQSATIVVEAIQAASDKAAVFVFGFVSGGPAPFEVTNPAARFSIAFQILPVVVVTAALAALLEHWGVLSAMIRAIGWALRRAIGVSGAVGFAAGASFFLGLAETPLFLRRHFLTMSRADLFAVITLGLSTVSGVVLVLYATTLGPVIPEVVAHILAASLMSLPIALAVARILEPPTPSDREREAADEDATADAEDRAYANSLDALAQGGLDGMKLFLNIAAMLLVLIASVALLDQILGLAGDLAGAPLSVQRLFGWAFAPIAFAVGAPWEEAASAGALFGTKAVVNEFIAYLNLSQLPAETLSPRTELLMVYALCGFSNLGSIGMLLGVTAAIAPSRRAEVARIAPKAWIAGNLATAITGAMIGVLTPPF